jgi:hypothetical protein
MHSEASQLTWPNASRSKRNGPPKRASTASRQPWVMPGSELLERRRATTTSRKATARGKFARKEPPPLAAGRRTAGHGRLASACTSASVASCAVRYALPAELNDRSPIDRRSATVPKPGSSAGHRGLPSRPRCRRYGVHAEMMPGEPPDRHQPDELPVRLLQIGFDVIRAVAD